MFGRWVAGASRELVPMESRPVVPQRNSIRNTLRLYPSQRFATEDRKTFRIVQDHFGENGSCRLIFRG
jgi:hypothetical protein